MNRRRLATELMTVRAECERLADAIARGGPLDVLLERLQARQARRLVLEGELAAERSLAAHTSPAALEQRLRAKLAGWRGLLTRNVSDGRAVLRTLLVGPLRFTPIDEERRRGYAFEGMIALDRLLSGVAICHVWFVPSGIRHLWVAENTNDSSRVADRATCQRRLCALLSLSDTTDLWNQREQVRPAG